MDDVLKKAFIMLARLVRRERDAGREMSQKTMEVLVHLDFLARQLEKALVHVLETGRAAYGDKPGLTISGWNRNLYAKIYRLFPYRGILVQTFAQWETKTMAEKLERSQERFITNIERDPVSDCEVGRWLVDMRDYVIFCC